MSDFTVGWLMGFFGGIAVSFAFVSVATLVLLS